MRPDDILYWLHAQPFRPFRITMNNGRAYEVRHPELLHLPRASMVYFTPSEVPGVSERAEMIGLTLIDHIEPVDAQVDASSS